ncbi:penicillin-insensitive murein endopeptidase [Falsiroseomonas ponticola]|uniref:penicillin-insensitive murein endopeptidase n=1 Tax=Falsiroseomonas ponticola TaxID=2786951 RepID=UPI00299D06DD|nr:penicillin-insensitive murein endopeptidase [Roseomonas ponticola]
MLAALAASPAFAAEGPLARAADWAALSRPTPGPARSIGTTNLGCIAGAVALPPEGPGWQAIRVSRNRHWGHPATIALVAHVAGEARRAGLPDLWIGDLGQPRGGPMPWGHASHQSGLDADIWLDLRPKPRVPAAQREELAIPYLVLPDESAVDPARWTPRHATLIRIAAEAPGLDRLLVNPAIKRRLCADHRGEPWLRRVRPWRGHDSHMHLRLRCPADSPECRDIAPPPPGDGCDATLDWWFTPESRQRPPPPARPPAPPRMPLACAALLSAPSP